MQQGIGNAVPVPRHWSQKRAFLAGKRGIEKPPFKLPAFIEATGIAKLRDSYAEREEQKSLMSVTSFNDAVVAAVAKGWDAAAEVETVEDDLRKKFRNYEKKSGIFLFFQLISYVYHKLWQLFGKVCHIFLDVIQNFSFF